MIIKRSKNFSKKSPGDREICPPDFAKKARDGEGVVQKIDGKWRVISLKTEPPSLWPQIFSSKEKGEKAVAAYHLHK